MVGPARLELATSPLSGVRSNHLSYEPLLIRSSFTPYNVKKGYDDSGQALYAKYILRKEVIQPHLPIRLPCYDFTPVIDHTVDSALPKVTLPASGAANSHGVTGGVYKARERIHRGMLIRDY